MFYLKSQDIISHHLMTSPFKSMYFQIFCKKYCRKTIEATVMKYVPNESKLINTINNYIVAFWCVVFVWESFKYKDKLIIWHFFGGVNISVNGNSDILKLTFTVNAFFLRTKSLIF